PRQQAGLFRRIRLENHTLIVHAPIVLNFFTFEEGSKSKGAAHFLDSPAAFSSQNIFPVS
ncbi:MAG TPA: hypothetical protein VLX61_11715, partial [Anaerolineales bacterium]|nr:hypothetical protein [Anaerolineales bacterium]